MTLLPLAHDGHALQTLDDFSANWDELKLTKDQELGFLYEMLQEGKMREITTSPRVVPPHHQGLKKKKRKSPSCLVSMSVYTSPGE